MKYRVIYQEIWDKNNIIDKTEEIEAKDEDSACDCIMFGSDCNNIKIISCLPYLLESEENNG